MSKRPIQLLLGKKGKEGEKNSHNINIAYFQIVSDTKYNI